MEGTLTKFADHQAWARAFGPLVKEGSIAKLRAFQREVRKVAASNVGPWHAEQVAGFIASVLEESGETKSAARSYRRLAREAHGEMMYHARSARDKSMFAAELYESLGKVREAKRLRREIADLDRFIESRLRLKKRADDDAA
jgi:hypothetical protein